MSEIGKADFVIRFRFRFRFSQPADGDVIARLTDSIRSYFNYKKQLQNGKLAKMMRTSFIFLVAGLVILGLSIALNEKIAGTDAVVLDVFAQGLTVAAWLSLWEALANFLINWTPYIRMRNNYDRIIHAQLLFD